MNLFNKESSFYTYTLPSFILAFLYVIAGEMSLELLSGKSIVNIGLFMPEGIALAFALFFGKRVLGGVFLGQFVLAVTHSIDFFPAFEISTINTLEALIAIIIFQKFHLSTKLNSLRDVVGLVLTIVFVLQPWSAIMSNAMLFLHTQTTIDIFVFSTFSWWFGNVMAQLVFTPFLLLLFSNYTTINKKEYFIYSAIFISLFLFFIYVLDINNPFLLMSFTIPMVVFVVVRKNLLYGTWMSVIVSVIASCTVYNNVGLFHADTALDNTINYNLFVLIHLSIVLMVGILFEERKKYESNLQKVIDKEIVKNKEQQLLMLQQSRMAQMGEMIAMIAHQWRQPLNNLSLINQILISKYKKKKLDDKVIEYFKENSKKQIDLMSSTIDDFRDFFKMEKEEVEFCVNEVIEDVLTMTKAIYTSNGIRMNFAFDGKFMLMGYHNALAQVILNIINNAKDALVESKTSEKEINIYLGKKDNSIYISISDTAGGIPNKIINKIFDPYFSTKKEKDGTGLGLYMSKMIVEDQMDAKLEVVNETKGANFKIIIEGNNCDK